VVADHIAACNAHDFRAWMSTFAPDALVNDNRREFDGADAIAALAQKELFGDRVTMAPVSAVERYGDVTVHAQMDGTYDKTGLPDPLILSFYFSVRDGLIVRLIIVHNRTEG
jgi:ketosteroid isomerase-like protein